MQQFPSSAGASATSSSDAAPGTSALSAVAAQAALRFAALRERAQEPPPPLSRPLTIAGRLCGRATLAACDALQGLPHIDVKPDELHIGAGMPAGAQLDALLVAVAARLREAQCLRGWRDELLDVCDASGVAFTRLERAAMRPLGLLTRAVHLNAWTPEGRLWVARRALTKATDPGMWDTLVGGLAACAEDLDIALARECAEEAGLTAADIAARTPLRNVLRLHRRLPEGYQVEDLLVSRCVLAPGVRPANQDGEVTEITTVTAEQALAMTAAGEFTLEAALVITGDLGAVLDTPRAPAAP